MSRKVTKVFFCTKEKVSYNVGDNYKGKRTDLESYLEPVKKKASQPKKPEFPANRNAKNKKK